MSGVKLTLNNPRNVTDSEALKAIRFVKEFCQKRRHRCSDCLFYSEYKVDGCTLDSNMYTPATWRIPSEQSAKTDDEREAIRAVRLINLFCAYDRRWRLGGHCDCILNDGHGCSLCNHAPSPHMNPYFWTI